MHRFWNLALQQLLEATAPGRILEIGAESGENTRRLLSWAVDHGAVLESIDPQPRFAASEWQARFAPQFVFHRQLSLEALPDIEPVDLALIDGDHNWYTVINELRLLDRGEYGPAVVLHDIDWPYGRRDLYYLPDTIPAQFRHEYVQAAIRPGEERPDAPGLNAHLCNALTEGGPRNGVRTAVEDFCAESSREWVFFDLPGLHGLGVIVSEERLRANPDLSRALAELDRPSRLRELTAEVESQRLWTEIRMVEARETAQDEIRTMRTQIIGLRSERDRLMGELQAEHRRVKHLEREEAARRRTIKQQERELTIAGNQLAYEQAIREEAKLLTERIAQAASWRWGQRAFLFLRTITFRTHKGTDAVTRLQQRLDSVEETGPTVSASGGAGGFGAAGKRRRSAPAEVIARQHFLACMAGLWPGGEDAGGPRDPLALPQGVDRRGVIIGPHPKNNGTAGPPTVDVVVCVHNALEDTRRCLWSLAARTTYPFHLILVDDGSDPETAEMLDSFAVGSPETDLIRHLGPEHGYTIAANLGLDRSTADYVVLLNSDTVVTSDWLERIVACGESDERIGILGPLSNAASHQSVPRLRSDRGWAINELPAWLNEEGMAALVRRLSRRQLPRLPFLNGFCYVVKRAVLDAVGHFDEQNFALGYCEENDFSYRAGQTGFELAVVDDAYVFHAKSRSYTPAGRSELAKEHYQVFLNKHDRSQIEELVAETEQSQTLDPLREALRETTASAPQSGRLIAGPAPLRVTFILPGISPGGSGGSHSIYQEVRGMREIGVPAQIAVSAEGMAGARWAYEDAAEIFRPFSDVDELAEVTAEAQVIVATHFKSVAMLVHLRASRQDFLPAYYIQDYEPFIVLQDHPDHPEVQASYTALPDALLFAKTHWLCNVVGQLHGLPVAKVEPSIDSGLFRPGERDRDAPIKVVAMVRPRTPRRQPAGTVAILERLRDELGEQVETITFGCEPDELANISGRVDTVAAHRGILKRHEVAELLGQADIFLDFSVYQAFGRTALEAMACGCAAIVPGLGGAAEFAVDGHNSLVVDTGSQEHTYGALAGLVRDREKLRRLQSAALTTGSGYSILRASISEYVLFEHEFGRRTGRRELDPLVPVSRAPAFGT